MSKTKTTILVFLIFAVSIASYSMDFQRGSEEGFEQGYIIGVVALPSLFLESLV